MKTRGYSILELLIVLFFIGLLAASAFPNFLGFYQRAWGACGGWSYLSSTLVS
jgi:type II secretory pathway pseudopilin PulG